MISILKDFSECKLRKLILGKMNFLEIELDISDEDWKILQANKKSKTLYIWRSRIKKFNKPKEIDQNVVIFDYEEDRKFK